MKEKIAKFLFIGMMNEGEDVLGWIETSRRFAEKSFVVMDFEKSTDDTRKLLEKNDVEVIEELKGEEYGDSDDTKKGPNGELTTHANLTDLINNKCQSGDWFMILAPDERLDPKNWRQIENEVRYADQRGYDGLVHYDYRTYYPSLDYIIDLYYYHARRGLLQSKFKKYTVPYEINLEAHAGYKSGDPKILLPSRFAFHHYCWVKKTRVPFAGWRDVLAYSKFPLFYMPNPISNWETLSTGVVEIEEEPYEYLNYIDNCKLMMGYLEPGRNKMPNLFSKRWEVENLHPLDPIRLLYDQTLNPIKLGNKSKE